MKIGQINLNITYFNTFSMKIERILTYLIYLNIIKYIFNFYLLLNNILKNYLTKSFLDKMYWQTKKTFCTRAFDWLINFNFDWLINLFFIYSLSGYLRPENIFRF